MLQLAPRCGDARLAAVFVRIDGQHEAAGAELGVGRVAELRGRAQRVFDVLAASDQVGRARPRVGRLRQLRRQLR